MGQVTHGLMWGIEMPRDVDWHGDEGDSVLEKFQDAVQDKIEAFAKKYPPKEPWDKAEDRFVPDTTSESSWYGLGFWVALGASGMCGVPYLGTIPLDRIETTKPYAKALHRAKRRWKRFAKWAKTQGIVLPDPCLVLAETEVA